MKKIIFFIGVVTIISFAGKAQVSEFDYQVSFPTGEFHDFIGKTNAVGFSGNWRKILANKRTSIGASFSWFYLQDKKGHTTIEKETGTITGNIANYTNIYPLLVVLQYDLKDAQKSVPFIRVGVGGAYQDQRTDAGIYTFQSDGFQFAMNGEAGVRISKDGARAIVLAATYHYFPAADDMVNAAFWGIKIGISNNKW
jgi:hypothetical protein